MKHTLSTHVLDTANGRPAAGVLVLATNDHGWRAEATTDEHGRAVLLGGPTFVVGSYRLEFQIGAYFSGIGHPDANRFLDMVTISFKVDDPVSGYHVPLLVSPWSYSTYRGS